MPIQIAKITKKYCLWLCWPALALSIGVIALPVHAEPRVVGHISFVKGSNAAQQPGAAPRILGKDTEIFQGDNIQTTERSFVIVEFIDGAKVTVRPNSNFSIEHYDSQSSNKNAQLVLHEGGVNASTGDIAKDKPESFQIKTPTATIKPNSDKAEFAIRVCDDACEKKAEEAAATKERTEQSPVARVVDIKGEVEAKNRAEKNAKERSLALGKPVYNSDFISSGKDSYALLVFPDGQKLTLQANSEMDINQYNYQIKGKKDQVLMRLATGSLRAITGSIGKNDHAAFALDTPVATIGIRGTIIEPEIKIGDDGTPKLTLACDSGEAVVKGNDGIEYGVPAGNTLEMSKTDDKPKVSPTPPDKPKSNAPAPENDKSDAKKVNSEKPASTSGDTAVKVISGGATLETTPELGGESETTELKTGDVASTDSSGDAVVTPASSPDSSHEEPGYNPFSGGPADGGPTGGDSGPSDPGGVDSGGVDSGGSDTTTDDSSGEGC
jgi:hypothetical protein